MAGRKRTNPELALLLTAKKSARPDARVRGTKTPGGGRKGGYSPVAFGFNS